MQVFQLSQSEKTIANKLGYKYFDFTKAVRVNGRDRSF